MSDLFRCICDAIRPRPRRPAGLGERGERLAEQMLRRKGLQIVARRVRTSCGEIDLVAKDRGTWVFIEVKTRRSDRAGDALEAVTAAKQRQLTRLALAYLKRHRLLDQPARFDVVGICWPTDDGQPAVHHLCNAFEASGVDSLFS